MPLDVKLKRFANIEPARQSKAVFSKLLALGICLFKIALQEGEL